MVKTSSRKPIILINRPMCDTLAAAVDDPTVAIGYARANRNFAIYFSGDTWREDEIIEFMPKWRDQTLYHLHIWFCPWTGHYFPGDVSDTHANILRRRFGVIPFEWNVPLEDIPIEYRTDKWWRDRKIRATSHVLKPDWEKPKRLRHVRVLSLQKWGPERLDEFEAKGVRVINAERSRNPGLRQFEGRPPHTCRSMFGALEYVACMVTYLPWVREYGIRKIVAGKPMGEQDPTSIVPIRYCPWCGTRLPTSLRPKWEAELAKRGLTPDSPDIPEDLMSELWWRGPDPIKLPKTGEIVFGP